MVPLLAIHSKIRGPLQAIHGTVNVHVVIMGPDVVEPCEVGVLVADRHRREGARSDDLARYSLSSPGLKQFPVTSL